MTALGRTIKFPAQKSHFNAIGFDIQTYMTACRMIPSGTYRVIVIKQQKRRSLTFGPPGARHACFWNNSRQTRAPS